MATAIRKTSITWGLVSVPVSIFKATDEHGSYKFHLFHQHEKQPPARINMVRRCSGCQTDVEYGDLVKGAEVGDDQVVIITEDDLASVERVAVHGITVDKFVPADKAPTSLLRDVYHVAPTEQSAVQGYELLRKVMAESNWVAVVKFALRNDAAHIGVLRAEGEVLTLTSMIWPEDVRQPDFKLLKQEVELPPKMLAAAKTLVESMLGEWDPAEYRDEYVAKVGELVTAKAAGKQFDGEAPEAVAEVGDLLAKLQASVKTKQQGKQAAKKAPAKKTAPKKSVA